jgi:hypothetical protein
VEGDEEIEQVGGYSTSEIADPNIVPQRITDGPVLTRREFVERWSKRLWGSPKQPRIVPKAGGGSVAKGHRCGCSEKLAVRVVARHREARAWPAGQRLLKPKPTKAQGPAKARQVQHIEAPKVPGAANLRPGHLAAAPGAGDVRRRA